MTPNPRATSAYRTWVRTVLDRCEPVCIRCGYPVDMDLPRTHPQGASADHEPPLSQTGDATPGMDGSGIAHLSCNKSHGGRLGASKTNAKRSATKPRRPVLEHTLPPPAAPRLRTPKDPKEGREGVSKPLTRPDGLLMPRMESGRHRACTGTYGPRAIEWLSTVYGLEVRGWQAYALDRALEHDEMGDLVWGTVIITVARQSGKSFLARAACMWRLHEGRELFGEEQTVLHVANKRETAMEVMRPAGLWATERYGKQAVKWGNTRSGIETPGGDRWLIHAANDSAGVGYTVSMVFVDEAWKVGRSVVDDSLAPTMAERSSPQLWLVSTAGDSTSDLLTAYRQRAMDKLTGDDPGDVLLLEWSAPADADPDQVDTWHWASPEWSPRREAFLKKQWAVVETSAWRTQYLNQWVVRADHWLKDGIWAATTSDRELPTVGTWSVALESDFDGLGHAVAVACLDADGVIVLRVTTHRTILECDEKITQLRREHPTMFVYATPSFIDRMRERIDGLVGQREAVAATQTLLDVLDRRALAHLDDQVLLEHFATSTISRRSAGWVLTAPMGSSGVYAARATMFAIWQAAKTAKPIPAIHVRRPKT